MKIVITETFVREEQDSSVVTLKFGNSDKKNPEACENDFLFVYVCREGGGYLLH